MIFTHHIILEWRNLFAGLSLLGLIFIVNLKTAILPVSGLTFILLALLTWFSSMCFTLIGLHKLLQHKEPLSRTSLYEYLKIMGVSKPCPRTKITLKADAESIRRLTNEINEHFISKWYCNISKNTDFTKECNIFLDEVLTRLIDVTLQVNYKFVLHGTVNIYLKHLKEFRRSLKRREKYNISIEELYRYSHICSTSNTKNTKNYFLHQMSSYVLRHFINSELWNSLPCHILVSVLTRRLFCYLLKTLSNPEVLNYIILSSVATNDIKQKLNLDCYGRISLIQFYDVIDKAKYKETDQSIISSDTSGQNNVPQNYKKYLEYKAKELEMKVEGTSKHIKKMEQIQSSASESTSDDKVVLRHRNHLKVEKNCHSTEKTPKQSMPVKIYESKSTTRTWRDSRDLACVSLGQDPLDYLESTPDSGGKVGTKPGFWECASSKLEESKHDSPPSATHLFNEVMHMTSMEGLKSSIKPLSDATERTLHNIKDLQETTVHTALHKIGDFQVNLHDKQQIENLNYLHYLPPHTLLHSSVLSNTHRLRYAQLEDEAAGVVEGLLDFGRAGFRKGLRLTGLQDNLENAKASMSNSTSTAKAAKSSMKEQVKKKLNELKRLDSDSQEKTSSAESVDSVWMNPLIDSPSFDGHILLEKSPKKHESNSPKNEDLPIPSISTEQPGETESPDLEYEDTADLASSIAKLRCLLQQRSSESGLSTPALSPMPDDYVQKQSESENVSDVEALEVDGVMPSFYKFCTKTASGVLSNTINTIKTALPGNNAEQVYAVEKWKFKSNQKDSETLIRMKKLLSERKEYCILDKEIDTAYDALDSVDIFQQTPVLSKIQFEDDMDDFEGKIPIMKGLIDIFCELFGDTNSPLIQEPMVKAFLLLFGTTVEEKVEEQIEKAMDYMAKNLINIPEKTNSNVLSVDLEDYIEYIRSSCPDFLRYMFGLDNYKNALKLFVSSIQHKKINEDVLLQVFEMIAMKLVEESTQLSPPASA